MTKPVAILPITAPDGRSLSSVTRAVVRDIINKSKGDDLRYLYRKITDEAEESMITVLMEHNNHNQSKTARHLGVDRMTLRMKLKKYDIIH